MIEINNKKHKKRYNDDVQKSFRTHTRQISNFGFPQQFLEKTKMKKIKMHLKNLQLLI